MLKVLLWVVFHWPVVGHLNVKAVYVQVSRDRLIPNHSDNTNSVENIFHMEPAPMRDVLNVTETF